MALIRFRCFGRVNKPLPSALVADLPSIKDNLTDLQTYARKINEGKDYEEDTNKVGWGNETDRIWFLIDLAVPLPMPQALQDKLPTIKNKIRQLKTYAVNTGEAAFFGTYHICHHDTRQPCEDSVDI